MNSRADAAFPGERRLIDHIRRRLPAAPASLLIGPGDDAAVLAPTRGAMQVLTTDAVVEGVHFDRRFSSLKDIGYKAVAVNLSDIVAMGASPEVVLLSLILPDGFGLADLDALLDGVLEMTAKGGTAIAGGNISRSPGPLIVDVTATGSVRPRRVLTRSGGHPGDAIYVTGTIGGAAAGLAALRSGASAQQEVATAGPLAEPIRRHQRPEPRLRMGMLLGRNRAASACMDLSDGLADGIHQVAGQSGTGAVIDASLLPIDPGAASWFEKQGQDPVLAALTGGDDYELLFTVSKKMRGRLRGVERHAQGLRLTRIGELTPGEGVRLSRGGVFEAIPDGFSHF